MSVIKNLNKEDMKMKRTKNDKFAIKRDDFRGYQSGRVWNVSTEKQYPNDFLKDVYKEWSKECTKEYNKYKSKDDLDGFEKWFDNTKFTADTLKIKYEEWKLQQNNA